MDYVVSDLPDYPEHEILESTSIEAIGTAEADLTTEPLPELELTPPATIVVRPLAVELSPTASHRDKSPPLVEPAPRVESQLQSRRRQVALGLREITSSAQPILNHANVDDVVGKPTKANRAKQEASSGFEYPV